MNGILRKTGIDMIGYTPWSTHFCLFYQSREELLELLIPYFKAGLENNEFCMWITSEPLTADDVRKTIAQDLPGFSKYVRKGQIEIISYQEWYLKGGSFNSRRVLDGWIEKLDSALTKGFDGLRLIGNNFWLEKKDWKSFSYYEAEMNNVIGKYKMLALCTYSLTKCNALEVMDVIRNHEFALAKQAGNWEIIENSVYKIAREALQESQEKFRHLYSSMNEGVALNEVVYDDRGRPKDYIITDVNPAFEFVTGLKKEAVIGQKASVIYQMGGPPYLEIFTRVEETGVSTSFETYSPLMKKHLSISAFSPEKGKFATLFSDITERKQAEEERKRSLKESQEQVIKLEQQQNSLEMVNEELLAAQETLEESKDRYEELYNSAPVGYLVLDQYFTILEANLTLAEMLSISKSSLVGSNFSHFVDRNYRRELYSHLNRVLEVRTNKKCELRMRRSDGSFFYAILDSVSYKSGEGTTIKCKTTVTDIDEQKRAKEEVEHIANEWQLTFNSIEDMVSIQDRNFKLLRVNKAYEEAVGMKQEDLVGKKCYEVVHGSACPPNACPHKNTMKTRKSVTEEIFEPRLGIYLETTTSPIFDGNGEVTGTVHIAKNITGRKKNEEKLRQRSVELEAANKELEAFSYSVSHDLRAPLRSINGFSQAISEDYADKLDEHGRDYLQRICRASQLMGQLIDDLLHLSRATMTELNYGRINLSELAQQIEVSLRNLQPQRKVEFIIEPGISVSGDIVLMRQVMENLLGNAFKFTARVPLSRIEFGKTTSGVNDIYYIKDNGAGFDMSYSEKLFKPFQRLHSQAEYPGTGIGLALVERIIKRHGGKVWAEGEPRKGATFFFTLR